MTLTLRRELRKKLNKVFVDWLSKSPAITDVIFDHFVLESEINVLVELLTDAALSVAGIAKATDETPATYNVLTAQEYQQANKKVDAILEMSKGSENHWQGRENVRADLLVYADWYNNVTGQVMTKRAQKAWWKALPEWKEEGLTVEHLQAAYDNRITWRKVITDPNELTKDAAAIKAAGMTKKPEVPLYKPLVEDHNVYVPNPNPRNHRLTTPYCEKHIMYYYEPACPKCADEQD